MTAPLAVSVPATYFTVVHTGKTLEDSCLCFSLCSLPERRVVVQHETWNADQPRDEAACFLCCDCSSCCKRTGYIFWLRSFSLKSPEKLLMQYWQYSMATFCKKNARANRAKKSLKASLATAVGVEVENYGLTPVAPVENCC